MSQRLEQRPWQDFLPKAFTWIDQLSLSQTDQLSKEAWHVVGVRKETAGLVLDASRLPAEAKKNCLAQARQLDWQGAAGQLKIVVDGQRFLLVALSPVKTSPAQKARQFGQDMAKALKDAAAREIVIFTPEALAALDVVDGLLSFAYDTQAFRGAGEVKDALKRVSVFGESLDSVAVKERLHLAKSLYLTRMLQDAPANWCHPERLAQVARDLFKGSATAKVQVLGPEELQKQGMEAMLAVARGSAFPAQLIVVEVKGRDTSKTMALVGKGLTFDSGGVSIKPAAGMGEMKYDMSGGASVLGTAYYLEKVTPACNVVCLIGAVENSISSHAYRPGDVLQSMNGKTIEVHNTDAEGRLVLCDVLTYAQRQFKPAFIVDIATLTGASLHALGHAGAAFMTTQDETARVVAREAERVGEPFWRLPLWPELEKEVKSELADLANIPKPNVLAGTIIGGIFLKEFIEDAQTEWVHMDIAGTAWSCAAAGFPEGGGTAYGLRTMAALCLTRFA